MSQGMGEELGQRAAQPMPSRTAASAQVHAMQRETVLIPSEPQAVRHDRQREEIPSGVWGSEQPTYVVTQPSEFMALAPQGTRQARPQPQAPQAGWQPQQAGVWQQQGQPYSGAFPYGSYQAAPPYEGAQVPQQVGCPARQVNIY